MTEALAITYLLIFGEAQMLWGTEFVLVILKTIPARDLVNKQIISVWLLVLKSLVRLNNKLS